MHFFISLWNPDVCVICMHFILLYRYVNCGKVPLRAIKATTFNVHSPSVNVKIGRVTGKSSNT